MRLDFRRLALPEPTRAATPIPNPPAFPAVRPVAGVSPSPSNLEPGCQTGVVYIGMYTMPKQRLLYPPSRS